MSFAVQRRSVDLAAIRLGALPDFHQAGPAFHKSSVIGITPDGTQITVFAISDVAPAPSTRRTTSAKASALTAARDWAGGLDDRLVEEFILHDDLTEYHVQIISSDNLDTDAIPVVFLDGLIQEREIRGGQQKNRWSALLPSGHHLRVFRG
ncbi:hypothetical protein DQ384_36770 [Sphaerisporangium album]|uniref:Uncharacterized protein n=1 Tax=Sphaerisporangium album TaxID=509200 RepID=A0A367ESR9_9ACTN|nr:hypothetical protein DQ384_36770 [Sphaerisporangium album]